MEVDVDESVVVGALVEGKVGVVLDGPFLKDLGPGLGLGQGEGAEVEAGA